MRPLHLSKAEKHEFWSLVKRGQPNVCWLWQGGKNGDGYGYFKQLRAHRLAYRLCVGLPQKFVLHTCNNRLCCNPAHLYDGSHQQNMRDMTKAGTHDGKNRRCEQHPLCILTSNEVKYVRGSSAKGVDLAEQFGVSQSLISSIRHRQRRTYD